MMKKVFFWTMTFLGVSFFYCIDTVASKAEVVKLDKIVAVVNSDVIMQSELDRTMALLKQQNSSVVVKDSSLRVLALDKLISELLQLQLARHNDIHVSDKDIDSAIAVIAKNNQITVEQLKKDLQEHAGLSIKQYREQINNQLLISRLRAPFLREITISDDEISSFLQKPKGIGNGLVKYHIVDILIETPDTFNQSQIETAKNIATKLALELKEKIVRDYGAFGQQINNSDLGWRKIDELPALFVEKILDMKAGQVSDPIRAPNGFHVIKLLEVVNERIKLTREQAREIIYNQKAEVWLNPWLKELRKSSYVKIM